MSVRDALGERATHLRVAGGFPTAETVQRAYDDADLNRAVQAYRFFSPRCRAWRSFGDPKRQEGDERVFGTLETEPEQLGFTLNSDTP